MKACPFCEAELRDSVIKCTRCGRSLLESPEDAAQEPARASARFPSLGAPTASAGTRGSPIGFPAKEPERAGPAVWATAAPPRRPTASGTVAADLGDRRALPGERRSSSGPDVGLLLAALGAVAAAVLAWQAIADPWVRLIVTDTSDQLDPKLVGDITLRGHAAFVGILGQGLAGVIGAFGVLWFLYGFDRGTTMPWFVNPAIAIVASIAGAIAVVVSASVWFVWQDAAVQHARAVHMTVQELRAFLDLKPEPLVEIERLPGLMRFAGAMGLGLLASCTGWWAYHQRG